MPQEQQFSTGDLMHQLRDELLLLIRQERAFLKAELREKLDQGKKAAALGTALVVTGYLAFVFLLVTGTLGLMIGLRAAGLQTQAPWMATLATAVVLLAVSGYLVAKLRELSRSSKEGSA